jgi:hypothetical protein
MLYSSSLQGLKQALGPFAGVYSADEEASYEALLEKASTSGAGGRGGGSSRTASASQRLGSVQHWCGGGGGGGGGGEASSSGAGGNREEADAPLTELENVRVRKDGWIGHATTMYLTLIRTLTYRTNPCRIGPPNPQNPDPQSQQLKLAERHLEKDSRVRLPGLKAGAPFVLHDNARAALQALVAGVAGPGVVNWLELSVHPDEQLVRLAGSKAVPALLALDADAGKVESDIAQLIAPVRCMYVHA